MVPVVENNNGMQKTFNATLVSHPDIYITEDSPKIFFLGSGKDWKARAINYYSNNWLEAPIVMCFYEGETTEELMPWIFYNTKNSDFILFHLDETSTKLDLMLAGLLASRKNVYISMPDTDEFKMLRILCKEHDANTITNAVEDRSSQLKRIWALTK